MVVVTDVVEAVLVVDAAIEVDVLVEEAPREVVVELGVEVCKVVVVDPAEDVLLVTTPTVVEEPLITVLDEEVKLLTELAILLVTVFEMLDVGCEPNEVVLSCELEDPELVAANMELVVSPCFVVEELLPPGDGVLLLIGLLAGLDVPGELVELLVLIKLSGLEALIVEVRSEVVVTPGVAALVDENIEVGDVVEAVFVVLDDGATLVELLKLFILVETGIDFEDDVVEVLLLLEVLPPPWVL